MLVVDAQAGRDARALDCRAMSPPLRGRVEHDVIGERDELAHLAVGICGRVGVDFAAELFACEPRLGDRARGRAGEILADERERRPLREALEREQDRATGARVARRRATAEFASSAPRSVTKHGVSSSLTSIARATSSPRRPLAHQRSSTCQGRPRFATSARNGSGSICSMFHTPCALPLLRSPSSPRRSPPARRSCTRSPARGLPCTSRRGRRCCR